MEGLLALGRLRDDVHDLVDGALAREGTVRLSELQKLKNDLERCQGYMEDLDKSIHAAKTRLEMVSNTRTTRIPERN